MTEMNNERNLVEAYEAPMVEVYEVEVERGFAMSNEAYGINEQQDW